jgi:exopolyphosphatase/guanosine-5'-triphosphate,3'-diphosphate pyrophosphatase
MRAAIIDLGTNTCNLLIAENSKTGFEILHQSKNLVRLGDDKIKEGEISAEATQRAIHSFLNHKKIIEKFNPEIVRVVATSAVRTASNKIEFLETLSETSGWLVKVITGEKEADLIFKGVILAFSELEQPSLILDIGGGSNELIIAKGTSTIWKESQPTGMARIINQFHLSDPIKPGEVEMLQKHLGKFHKAAVETCITAYVQTLVGCSGAFDTIADMIDGVNPGEKTRKTQEITLEAFYNVYHTLLKSTREERLVMKGMDFARVDLIVPAVVLIEFLIAQIKIGQIIQTDFALREGAFFELMKMESS